MNENQGSKRASARQQRKKAERKRKIERRQNRATRKALKYTIPKNSLIAQANLVSSPQISRGFVKSSMAKELDMYKNVNKDLNARDVSEKNVATQVASSLMLSLMKADLNTSLICDSMTKKALADSEKAMSAATDKVMVALQGASVERIEESERNMRELTAAMREMAEFEAKEAGKRDVEEEERDFQRNKEESEAADAQNRKIWEAFGKAKATFEGVLSIFLFNSIIYFIGFELYKRYLGIIKTLYLNIWHHKSPISIFIILPTN